MPGLHPHIDPDGLLEYSVVFTDRSLNHMSERFRAVMKYVSATLKHTYAAKAVSVVPGGGTYAMEAVARQFGTGKRCFVIRNGWFSYRWTQIFDAGRIPSESTVLRARPAGDGPQAPFAPPPVDEVTAAIAATRPDVVFAPHVETSSGILLPNDYLRAVADAAHDAGGLFVLDSIASGAIWVDMEESGVDVLISAPQKGWSASPCAGLVMLGAEALARMVPAANTSFACDLLRWLHVMEAYESGKAIYHSTMPTDALRMFHDVMVETEAFGFDARAPASTSWGTECGRCWRKGASPALPLPASKPPVSSSATPTSRGSRTAPGSPTPACRSPRGCLSCATSPRDSGPSAWGCSDWTSSETWTGR